MKRSDFLKWSALLPITVAGYLSPGRLPRPKRRSAPGADSTTGTTAGSTAVLGVDVYGVGVYGEGVWV